VHLGAQVDAGERGVAVKTEDFPAIGRAAKVELRAATTSSSVCGCEPFDNRLDDHEILIITLIEDSETAIMAFAPAHSLKSRDAARICASGAKVA
jgi:hypothetical protein